MNKMPVRTYQVIQHDQLTDIDTVKYQYRNANFKKTEKINGIYYVTFMFWDNYPLEGQVNGESNHYSLTEEEYKYITQ
ncbi:hypothetical protein KK120_18750 [Virgibacillus dakarensis]|nr:hypothetical protein [Virgibacillus dakarensis]